MKPKISVIIPTHNRSDLLIKRSLKSVINQTFQDWECIVVDDGSTDSTKERVTELIQRDDRIRYVYQDNRGAASARNAGIKVSQGALIALLDSDDEFLPHYLATMFEVFGRSSCDVMIIGSYFFGEDEFGRRSVYRPKSEPFWQTGIACAGCTLRREVFLKHHIWFDENLKVLEDVDFGIRLLGNFKGIVIDTPSWVCYFRVNTVRGFSLTSTPEIQPSAFDLFFKKHFETFKKEGRDTLSYFYFLGGTLYARAGRMREAKKYFIESFKIKPTLKVLFYLVATMVGVRGFYFFESVKNTLMRNFRILLKKS